MPRTKRSEGEPYTVLASAVEGLTVEIASLKETTGKALDALVHDINRHEELFFGDGDQKVGLIMTAKQNTDFRKSVQDEGMWFRRVVTVAIITSLVGILVGCLKIDQLTAQVATDTHIMVTEAKELPTATPRPVDTPTPTYTPTSSIVEVTPNPTPSGPIEVGTVMPLCVLAPAKFCPESGVYTPYKDQGVCVSPGCTRYVALLPAGKPVKTQASTQQGLHEYWLCMFYEAPTKDSPAEECMQAILWVGPNGMNGRYEIP